MSNFKLNITCTNGSDRTGVMYSRRNVAVQRTNIVFLDGTEDDFFWIDVDVVEIWLGLNKLLNRLTHM